MPPETFSSEIGDVHEHGRRHDSFSDEFRGASDSLIEHDRPPRTLDAGRRGRRLMWLILLVVGLLGGGGWAFWYWSEPIGEWIAGLGRETKPEESEPEAAVEPAPTPDLPSEAGPDKVFGIPGAPDGSGPLPPTEPRPETPTPETPPSNPTPAVSTKIERLETKVRGQVSTAVVSSRLAKLDAALAECWAQAKATAPVELELSFRIKWSGRAQSIAVSGGSDALNTCAREAVPSSGWPKPRDGGEARVTHGWKLGG